MTPDNSKRSNMTRVESGDEREISFHAVLGFRDRAGWCVVARVLDMTDESTVEYECTKQYPDLHACMQAFSNWMRRMSTEDEIQ